MHVSMYVYVCKYVCVCMYVCTYFNSVCWVSSCSSIEFYLNYLHVALSLQKNNSQSYT